MSPRATDEEGSSAASPRARKKVAKEADPTPSWAVETASNDQTTEDSRREKTSNSAQSEASGHPVKRMKRGKYISRAWYDDPDCPKHKAYRENRLTGSHACSVSCQQRKIKCEGGEPCAQCVARKRACVSGPRGGQSAGADSGSGVSSDLIPGMGVGGRSSEYNSVLFSDGVMGRNLLARLAEVERQLEQMRASGPDVSANSRNQPSRIVSAEDENAAPNSAELQNVLETDGQTFVGELSMSHAIPEDAARNGGELLSEVSPNSVPGLSPENVLPRHSGSFSATRGGVRKVRGWLESILEGHGLIAEEKKWREYLQLYLDEIHILYPILHPPTLWEIFEEMWENSVLWPMTNAAEREQKRLSVALVCFCLALGRCTVSTRMMDASGVCSSGWSLYSVGMSLVQDVMEMSNSAAKSLLALQIIIIRALYLFRLDATQRAARLLAIAVTNAHIIGINRQATLDRMPVLPSQLYCRTWWCIYTLDRRFSIESGRPFLVQDSNIDTAPPLNLSDEWLSRYSGSTQTTADLSNEIAAEVATSPVTTIPYLLVMIRFSRVVGKAWELLYGLKASSPSSSAMVEYADNILCKLLDKIPSSLIYDPKLSPDLQFETRPRWLVKQSMLLFMCCTSLRVLIRRPFSVSSTPTTEDVAEHHHIDNDEDFESLAVCTSLASSILSSYETIQDDFLKYCFPFNHYLTSTTMVMIDLVARKPDLKRRYAELVLSAARSLNVYCHRVWVSGKTMRWVLHLTKVVREMFSDARSGASKSQQGSIRHRRVSEAGSRADDMQQLTPQSDNYEHNKGRNALASSGYRRMSTVDYDFIFTNPDSQDPRANGRVGGDADLWVPHDVNGGADLQQTPVEPPGWVLSDFNFETMLSGGETVASNRFSSELSNMSNDTALSRLRAAYSDIDGNADNSIFGGLGLGSTFDMDVDMDQTMIHLDNSVHMGL